jgi:CheY-like chemotaxis protein
MEKRRILIVDNNDELRALLEEGLGKLGHEVVVTGEREKALARTDLDEFDLVISDLSEAEVNGAPDWRSPAQTPRNTNNSEICRTCDYQSIQDGGSQLSSPALQRRCASRDC